VFCLHGVIPILAARAVIDPGFIGDLEWLCVFDGGTRGRRLSGRSLGLQARPSPGVIGTAVWWLRLGITIERIQPGHPQQNGRHERIEL